jgi:hypothetical protein
MMCKKNIPWKHDGPFDLLRQFVNLVCEKCLV